MKDYFFGLRGAQLERVLTEYGRQYGSDKEAYARATMSKWKSGRTQMSGLVAKRLFSLLPELMPLDKKFELAGNLWRFFGPQSQHSYVIGPETSITEIESIVAARLSQVVLQYQVPDNLKKRFSWLAKGDVTLSERMLNHFRQQEKELVLDKLRSELPVLQRHMRESANFTKSMKQTLTLQKHTVEVWLDASGGATVREGSLKPAFFFRSAKSGTGISEGGWDNLGFFGIVGIIILILVLISR
ncbi:hypothetical protein DK847_09115 [Aestuariivirga litoralis]|uniref:Uncharacterized protein n=1 Tax=Aestuariivirga litoralis TaxID=2650924 RepID=A0A2W2BVG1_9HYPH|nr:hypothetical protein DK847_09115 [Aestuariivirga litoralis]